MLFSATFRGEGGLQKPPLWLKVYYSLQCGSVRFWSVGLERVKTMQRHYTSYFLLAPFEHRIRMSNQCSSRTPWNWNHYWLSVQGQKKTHHFFTATCNPMETPLLIKHTFHFMLISLYIPGHKKVLELDTIEHICVSLFRILVCFSSFSKHKCGN